MYSYKYTLNFAKNNTTLFTSADLCKNPILSIITIIYNHKPFIPKLIESVTSQKTNFEFEHILADDCSTDGSNKIISKYQKKCPEIVVHLKRTENLGRHSGNGRLNFIDAISHSRGNYIAVLDGDDYWTDPYKLQKQVDYLEANPSYAYCFHPVKMLYQKTGELVSTSYGAPRIDSEYNLNDLLENCNFVPSASLLFRTNLIQNLPNSFVHYPFGDWPLQMIALLKHGSEKFGCIQEEMAVYRYHDKGHHSGRSTVFNLRRVLKTYRLVGYYLNLYSRYSWRKGYSRWNIELAKIFSSNRKLLLEYYHIIIAFIISPYRNRNFVLYECTPRLHQIWEKIKRRIVLFI